MSSSECGSVSAVLSVGREAMAVVPPEIVGVKNDAHLALRKVLHRVLRPTKPATCVPWLGRKKVELRQAE